METENIDRLVDLARDGSKDALEILKKRTRDLWDHAHKLGLNVVDVPARVSEVAYFMTARRKQKAATARRTRA
jgi:hypothetical protein